MLQQQLQYCLLQQSWQLGRTMLAAPPVGMLCMPPQQHRPVEAHVIESNSSWASKQTAHVLEASVTVTANKAVHVQQLTCLPSSLHACMPAAVNALRLFCMINCLRQFADAWSCE
jgi:hypothetical protein